MEETFLIGVVTGTHGIRGTLRVYPTTDEPERFSLLKEVFLDKKGVRTAFRVQKVAYHKQFVLLTLAGIPDMTAAEGWKNAEVRIPADQALPLDENEYYLRDLLGIRVVSDTGEELGVLVQIYETGANDVYAVRDPKNPQSRELLLPAIRQCILNVNVADRVMTVHVLEGLKD